MAKKPNKLKDKSPRFGIGEWYGFNVNSIDASKRRHFANESLKTKKEREKQPCPFMHRKAGAICSKDGGVCSLLLYEYAEHTATGRAMGKPKTGKQGELRATCPNRFHQDNEIFKWVGEVILGDADPAMVGEVGFLEAAPTTDSEGGDDVGRIDMVLVSNKTGRDAPMEWAALEIQAVYFSGNAMPSEFKAYSDEHVDWTIFPAGKRRPDYRSSGPKRLMPQLQIKVPTLRRWGKKMAVIVDSSFFDSIGEMDHVADISNADIAWFIVKFEPAEGSNLMKIVRHAVRYTTLERSVEGLTGGKPVSRNTFETRIGAKLPREP